MYRQLDRNTTQRRVKRVLHSCKDAASNTPFMPPPSNERILNTIFPRRILRRHDTPLRRTTHPSRARTRNRATTQQSRNKSGRDAQSMASTRLRRGDRGSPHERCDHLVIFTPHRIWAPDPYVGNASPVDDSTVYVSTHDVGLNRPVRRDPIGTHWRELRAISPHIRVLLRSGEIASPDLTCHEMCAWVLGGRG